MSPAPAPAVMASVGDHGVLNASLPEQLAGVWLDRDLSWLDFNERVLAEALDERTPLLERAKFLAIFTSNLDEFFMKRMAVLRDHKTPAHHELFGQLRAKLLTSLRRQAECFTDAIVPGLARHGVLLQRWDDLTPAQQREAGDYFDNNLSPALTPLVINVVHPFPFIANLSTSLTFILHDPVRKEQMYARVRIPSGLKQWIPLTAADPGQRLFVPLHEVVRGNIHKLYSGMILTGATLVRLTRDAEVELDDDPEAELREAVEEQVRQRRYEPAVRLEFGPGADPAIREMLRERFHLSPSDVYDLAAEVDYTTLFELMSLPLPELHDAPWTPLPLPALDEDGPAAIFSAMQAGDVLVHHPYESFDASVEHFVSTAADDPCTISIKMTAYRIGDDTPFVKSLIRAAEHGGSSEEFVGNLRASDRSRPDRRSGSSTAEHNGPNRQRTLGTRI